MPLRIRSCLWIAALSAASLSPVSADVHFPSQAVRPESGRKLQREGQTWHPVQVDNAALRSVPKSGVVQLPSTRDRPLAVRFQKLEQRGDGLAIWTGKVATDAGEQSVVLTLGNGLTFGLIPQVDGPPLRIETRHGKTWLIEGEPPVLATSEDDFTLPPLPTSADLAQRRRQDAMKAVGDPQVDVLVLYTPGLVNVWGSMETLHARIAQLEAITRQSYVDSGAAIDIRVVGRHLVDYTTKNTNADALTEMRGTVSSPLYQEAARMRSLYGADLVVLMRHFERGINSTCGNGYILGYHGGAFSASNGFSVVADHGYGNDNCGDWTFAHELGHNMGAHHDTETAEGDYGAYVHSRGHRQTLAQYRGFATIMAYDTADQWRLGIFSTPLLNQCLGQSCGIADSADNARGFTSAAPALANLVPAVPLNTQPAISISDVAVTEGHAGSSVARFTISLSAPAAGPVELTLGTTNGSAIAGTDFDGVPAASRTLSAGQTSLDFDVTIHGDTEVEADEVFGLSVQSVSGAVVADGQGIATIVNDEAIPTLTVDDVARPEGNAGAVLVPVTVRLSAPSPTPVGFSLNAHEFAAGPTSATEGEDFTRTNLPNLSIPAGLTSETVYVASLGDTTEEQGESLYVIVGDVTGALVGDARAVVTLLDDDGPVSTTPRLGISDSNAVEGTNAAFVVSLSAPATTTVSFDVATVEQAATPGSDYVPLTSTASIPAGQTSTTITVPTVGDSAVEPDEDYWVLVSNATGAVIDDFRGVGWIRDNDTPTNNPGPDPLADFRLRDDRAIVLNGQAPTSINILANDVFDQARLAGGSLTLVSYPMGLVTITDNNTPTQPADDTIVYSTSDFGIGEEVFRYRLCEGGAGARCAEASVRVMVRPVLDLWTESDTGSGFTDIVVPRERQTPSEGDFTPAVNVSVLVAPERIDQVLNVDPTPSTPWDQSFAGTTVIVRELTAQAGESTVDWRVLADARMPGGDVDVYMGLDADQDGAPDQHEVRCVAAMSEVAERCEILAQRLFTTTGGSILRYWVMLHNRSATSAAASAEVFVVPMPYSNAPVASALVATAQGMVQAQEPYPLRLAWTDLTLLPGESRLAYVRLDGRDSTSGIFPVRIDRTNGESPAVSLVSGVAVPLRLAPGAAQDRMYIDVPMGASNLSVTTTSAENVDLYLAHDASPSSPDIAPAPARSAATVSAVGAGGNEALGVSGGQLLPGRWYVTPVNAGTSDASLELQATVTGAVLPTRPGSYFNAARSGHGLFLYPAADQWTGLWYTYLQDGTPTWYYLQGPQPGSNGLWVGTLYRSAWDGDSNALTVIGRGQVAPSGPDAFTFTYTLDGETGSEPLAAFGRGCPMLAGQALDVSSTWFNPARAGAGYSVQMFEDYEFYAAFIYDQQGIARFALAESTGFAGADATLSLEQLGGFCPLCTRNGNPARQSIGTLARRFSGGSFANIAVDGIFAGALSGAWTADEAIQPLGGPATVQGCLP